MKLPLAYLHAVALSAVEEQEQVFDGEVGLALREVVSVYYMTAGNSIPAG
jgi:hypothetical protein